MKRLARIYAALMRISFLGQIQIAPEARLPDRAGPLDQVFSLPALCCLHRRSHGWFLAVPCP